ncbi:MAG: alkaline phosphatase family protein [Crocinitomicaceae bacterium]|nr:alkaline phosphatase family protein [Crocinitomicaceae bacterium]
MMMIRIYLSGFLIFFIYHLQAQVTATGNDGATTSAARTYNTGAPMRPKLIVGITVDQMRYDYIDKYWGDLSNDGFKRMVKEGFFARNIQYPYTPTYTGPGHAAIFTGSTPAYNGIIANDWFERSTGKFVYCSADSAAIGIGTSLPGGKMSPHYLQSTTIGDELKLFSNKRSKVIGIALKDRGSILPAGRTADAAYWFVGESEGVWVTSSWYMKELPGWVTYFNARKKPDEYLSQDWYPLLDESFYDESSADNNAFEQPFKGTIRPVFPYRLSDLKAQNGRYDLLKSVPFGNTLTIDFAKAAIEGEEMGRDEYTDMLCLSFSATDYIGHQFGIHSRESQDAYLRLDRDIAAFLKYLDETIGKGAYLVFLTADHGGTPTPGYMKTDSAAAGYWKSERMVNELQSYLFTQYGAGKWVINESNQNIFLNHDMVRARNLSLRSLQEDVRQFLLKYDEIAMTYSSSDLSSSSFTDKMGSKVQLGFSQKNSGDVIYVLKPGYIEYGLQGTTHGSPYMYDSHVPLLFFGYGINQGESFAPHSICDIAPTVAAICKIPPTNACIGEPIMQIVK